VAITDCSIKVSARLIGLAPNSVTAPPLFGGLLCPNKSTGRPVRNEVALRRSAASTIAGKRSAKHAAITNYNGRPHCTTTTGEALPVSNPASLVGRSFDGSPIRWLAAGDHPRYRRKSLII
jgi:hypothetical protein